MKSRNERKGQGSVNPSCIRCVGKVPHVSHARTHQRTEGTQCPHGVCSNTQVNFNRQTAMTPQWLRQSCSKQEKVNVVNLVVSCSASNGTDSKSGFYCWSLYLIYIKFILAIYGQYRCLHYMQCKLQPHSPLFDLSMCARVFMSSGKQQAVQSGSC